MSCNNLFPEFFRRKECIETTVVPIKFSNRTYFMSSTTKNPNNDQEGSPGRHKVLKPYQDNDDGIIDCGDIDDSYEVSLTKTGKFMTQLYVPSPFLAHIIGARGSRLKTLERSTNTLIKIPRMNETGDVKIIGETERNVVSARTQIVMIVTQRRDRLPSTHFMSIPLNLNHTLTQRFLTFKNDILLDVNGNARGITESMFQKPIKLHLTIVVLRLLDEESIKQAKHILQACYNEFISNLFDTKDGNKLISVRGLEIMNDDPSDVRILYAKVRLMNDDSDKLQQLADKIRDYFARAGLAKKEYDHVTLHVTLMNTSFRDETEERQNFDACDILKKYRDFDFGVAQLKDLQLSVRHSSSEEKYYDSLLNINI